MFSEICGLDTAQTLLARVGWGDVLGVLEPPESAVGRGLHSSGSPLYAVLVWLEQLLQWPGLLIVL